MIEEVAVVNPRKKRRKTRRKPARRRTTRAAAPKRRYRRRAAAPKRRARRRSPAVVVINPVQRDVVKALKDAGIVTAGIVAGIALADYAAEKIEAVKENEWAPGAVMVAGGIGAGMILKGKNKALGAKLALGMMAAGVLTVARPYLAGKVPGFPAEDVMVTAIEPTAGYVRTAGRPGWSSGVGAYFPDMPATSVGAYDAYGMGAYADSYGMYGTN